MPTAASVAANCALASLIFEVSAMAFCFAAAIRFGVRFPDGGLRGIKFLRGNGVCFPQRFHPLKVSLAPARPWP